MQVTDRQLRPLLRLEPSRFHPMPSPLASGDRAPQIALIDAQGVERRSEALAGKALVLFFYPKDDTPGCTAEAVSYTHLTLPTKRIV